MKNSWETYRLGDVTKWSSGGTPKKSESSYWGGSIPWISASSMDGHLYGDSKLKITEEGLANGSRLAPAHSILLLVRGSILHQKIQVGLTTKEVAFNQDVKCLVPNEDFLDSWYLLLWFKAKEKELLNLVESTGIGAGKFDTKLLSEYPIEIPPKHELETIKEFGKALFDKSINLVSTNQTLEQMAQALFKSWFVDFDPVLDNALAAGNSIPDELPHRVEVRKKAHALPASLGGKGQPLPDNIRNLFPNEFEQTGEPTLGIDGWVPKGWHVSTTKDEFDIRGGATPSTKNEDFWDGDIHWTSPKDLSGNNTKILLETARKITEQGLARISSGLLPKNTVLMSSRAPVGYLAFARIPVAINQGYIALICNKRVSPEYAIYFLESRMDEIKGVSGGTTFAEISKKTFKEIKMLVPNNTDLIESFSANVSELFSKVEENERMTSTLSLLRDRLLPKLISGEIKLDSTGQNSNKEAELQGV